MIQEIKSRFSVAFILALTSLLLISAGLSVVMTFGIFTKAFFAFVFFLILFGSLLVFVIQYILRYVSIITITEDKIRFRFLLKEVQLEWNDIKEIHLTEYNKMNLGLFRSITYDAAKIITEENKTYFLPYQHYSNYVTLLKMLEQVATLRENRLVEQKIQLAHFKNKKNIFKNSQKITGKKYSGSVFRSFNFYAGLIVCLFFTIVCLLSGIAWLLLIPLCFIFFFYIAVGKMLYYFIVSDTHLTIKNMFFPFKEKNYSFDEIRELVFRSPDKSPTELRVITHDFDRVSFPGDGLTDKTWKELINDLTDMKISIRNETHL